MNIARCPIRKTESSARSWIARGSTARFPRSTTTSLGILWSLASFVILLGIWTTGKLSTSFSARNDNCFLIDSFRTPSPSVQNTLYMSEKEALENVPAINWIEMTMPNKHYINFDFSKLKGLEGTSNDDTVYLPLDKPSGVIYGKLDRKASKLWFCCQIRLERLVLDILEEPRVSIRYQLFIK